MSRHIIIIIIVIIIIIIIIIPQLVTLKLFYAKLKSFEHTQIHPNNGWCSVNEKKYVAKGCWVLCICRAPVLCILLLFGSYAQLLLQVQVNLAKDVLKKVETNLEQHKQYSENYEKAKVWIENAKQVIWDCSEASSNSSREVLQARLEQIQVS
jgi:hypothetical protein